MNLNRKLFFILLFIISINRSYSQSFGFQFGLNSSSISQKSSNSLKIVPKYGLHIGVNYSLPIHNNIVLETGLYYTNKGFNYQVNFPDYYGERNYILDYLEVPLNIRLDFSINNNSLFFLTGGYLAYGISGYMHHRYIDLAGDMNEENRKIEWGENEIDDFKRLDYGIDVGGGIKFKSYQISIIYEIGLNDIMRYVIKSRVYTIALTYCFNG